MIIIWFTMSKIIRLNKIFADGAGLDMTAQENIIVLILYKDATASATARYL